MRNKENINKNWFFSDKCTTVVNEMPTDWQVVDLSHTWNAADGQDGGADYYRGACYYVKNLDRPLGQRVYIEFEAAENAATVYVNGDQAAYHEGGYSTFRVDITDKLGETGNIIAVCVDNCKKDNIYPQVADFTFYGGLYRDVNIIIVAESHFDLDYLGGNGLNVTTEIKNRDAIISLEAFITNPAENQTIEFNRNQGRLLLCKRYYG